MSPTFPTANHAAFVTITALAVITAGSVVAAATITSTVAAVAYATLGITAGGLSIGSVTAWIDPSSVTAKLYFVNFKKHAAIAVAGTYQFVAQTLLQAFIRGCAEGLAGLAYRRFN
jgi:hypothetical protein